jgi:hypothetical protein
VPLFSAFAASDSHDHSIRIDVVDLEVRRFGESQPAGTDAVSMSLPGVPSPSLEANGDEALEGSDSSAVVLGRLNRP